MKPSDFFKCLADETRFNLVMLILHHRELCVCEFTDLLGLSQPKISRHLAQLRSYGILSDRRQGKWVHYRINPELPAWCLEVIQTTFAQNSGQLHTLLNQPLIKKSTSNDS
ncbi:MAG: transcriptional regulator [Neptuniibacter caesariensis]|uniref:Transcriptional regulator n=1 Tax=Neptuniibacter caesariensis TaxID=207954 RepID=A0A2G6JLE7_NEPCE|nr:MAG: transcriptional regulator [Neptuniibacter caesariensis]